ncbi:MAG: histidine kinase dimerization/phospho-acceptor domain-containing protein [Pseudomonadota bacterium]
MMRTATSCRLIGFGGGKMIVSHVYNLTERDGMAQKLARQAGMLHQSEKRSAFCILLAGVAHEFNNPLSLVVGHAPMLAEERSDLALRTWIGKISAAAERCAKAAETFLAMARAPPAPLEAVSVAETIETAADVADYGLRRSGVDILLSREPDLPAAGTDSDQRVQACSNLW